VNVQLLMEIAAACGAENTQEDIVPAVFPKVLQAIGADAGGIYHQHQGEWKRALWCGENQRIPDQWIADALDAGRPQFSGAWHLIPLSAAAASSAHRLGLDTAAAVAIRFDPANPNSPASDDEQQRRATALAEWLATAVAARDRGQQRTKRIQHLTLILQAAAKWQQLDDDNLLLHRIADTATALLACERASIFLWDKRRGKLIGRPALGIAGGALEVADSAGIVGEVLRTGEPRFWTTGSDDESRINRSIDHSQQFETRSLVAVAMTGGRGELIGVFEAINHRDGGFDPYHAEVLADLALHAAAAIESLRKRRQLKETCDRLVQDAAASSPLIGNHASIEEVRRRAEKIAATELSVLILGDNGTGKEVLARHVHYHSQRRQGPFVAVNCAALVETLLESELFGHQQGAFTDADRMRRGKFELASGGTLFLDEIGDLSLGGQAKLLRVLEDKVVVRVGGDQPIPVDVRVIAATNQPLGEMIQARRFREDLFFRLNVVTLTLPSLAQRGEDVVLLTEHFLETYCAQIGRPVPKLHRDAMAALKQHAWPGNIRELRNTVERICYLCPADTVRAADLMLTGGLGGSTGEGAGQQELATELTSATKQFQITHIQSAIDQCRGNMTEAAELLGLHRSNLYRKMRQLGIPTAGE
jgi:DNA-binding NtrC family response regulator